MPMPIKYYVILPDFLSKAINPREACQQILNQVNQNLLAAGVRFFKDKAEAKSYMAVQPVSADKGHCMLTVEVDITSNVVLTSIDKSPQRFYALSSLEIAKISAADIIKIQGFYGVYPETGTALVCDRTSPVPQTCTPISDASTVSASCERAYSPMVPFERRRVLDGFDLSPISDNSC